MYGGIELGPLLLGALHQSGVLISGGGGLLGQHLRTALSVGPIGDGALGTGSVLGSRLLGLGSGRGCLAGDQGLLAGGGFGGLTLGQGGDNALGQLGGVPLCGLAARGFCVGQVDVIAGGGLGRRAGALGALRQFFGSATLGGVLGGCALGLGPGDVGDGRGLCVFLGQAIGLGPSLDRLPCNLLSDQSFSCLFSGGELSVAT